MPSIRQVRPVREASSFGQGAFLPFRALSHLGARPKWWFLIAIPLVINLVLFVVAITWGFTVFADMLRGWLAGHEAWYWAVLRFLIQFFFGLAVLILVYFVFTPLALLIAAPFNDRLGELTERALGIELPPDPRSLVHSISGEALFAVVAEAKRLGVVVGVFVVLLPLHLVPVVGSILYAVAGVYFGARFASMEFMGYAADRRHLGFSEKWAMTRAHHSMCMGYGLVTLGLLAVPFVNVFAVPLSAVAGTMLFSRVAPEDLRARRLR